MKVGDKVVCITDHSNFRYLFNIKGKEYKVFDIVGNMVYITTELNGGHCVDFVIGESKIFKSFFYYKDYFISLQELRSKKLKRLHYGA